MPAEQIARRDVEEIVDGKLAEIETNLRDATSAMIDDRLQSLDLPRRPDNTEILETARNSFDGMDFVREVHYEDSDYGLRLIVIHDHSPPMSAFSAISSRVSDIASSTDRFDMTPWILHESEALPHHTRGAKLLFERTRKSRDTTGSSGDRSQHGASGRLDDPEALDVIKSSFDDMDFVRRVYHRYEDGDFVLIIVHDSKDFGHADSAVCNRIVKMEDLLCNVHIGTWILHESEDLSLCLDGAKLLFERRAEV